jgi:hypothetical protein
MMRTTQPAATAGLCSVPPVAWSAPLYIHNADDSAFVREVRTRLTSSTPCQAREELMLAFSGVGFRPMRRKRLTGRRPFPASAPEGALSTQVNAASSPHRLAGSMPQR